jgi:hypothetical protein
MTEFAFLMVARLTLKSSMLPTGAAIPRQKRQGRKKTPE